MSPIINPTLPTPGQPNATEDIDVLNALTAILGLVNGSIDDSNIAPSGLSAASLAAAVVQAAGLNDGGAVRRGKSVIATEEARTNAAYGLMTTPDRVQNVVVPTDGLVRVSYVALWKESVLGAARAALFVGANQFKNNVANSAPTVQECGVNTPSGVNFFVGLMTASPGLFSKAIGGALSADASFVTTGTDLSFCQMRLAAGTYDFSVQFKASSGTVTVKERLLIVETLGF